MKKNHYRKGNQHPTGDLHRFFEDGGVNSLNGGVNNKIESADGGLISMEIKLLQAIKTAPGLNAPAHAIS